MTLTLLNKTLIMGIDDSNHAGTAKGEIIPAVFSHYQEDSLVKIYPVKRDVRKVDEWLNDSERDYRFTILTDERYRRTSNNLVVVAPLLVRSFLLDAEKEYEILKIYFDGKLSAEDKNHLRRKFRDFKTVVIDNFVKIRNKKRNVKSGKFKCPQVVCVADCLANKLFRTLTGDLLVDRRFVPFK